MLSEGIILLYDNARPHTANLVRDKLQRFGGIHFDILRTAQIFPLVTFTFWRAEERHSWTSRRFHSGEEVHQWVMMWIHQRPISFYKTGTDRLVYQWDIFFRIQILYCEKKLFIQSVPARRSGSSSSSAVQFLQKCNDCLLKRKICIFTYNII